MPRNTKFTDSMGRLKFTTEEIARQVNSEEVYRKLRNYRCRYAEEQIAEILNDEFGNIDIKPIVTPIYDLTGYDLTCTKCYPKNVCYGQGKCPKE